MAEDQALRDALGVAQRQLLEAETELREVQERVRNLRSVVYGLKQIFEPGDAGRVTDSVGADSSEPRAKRRRGHGAEGAVTASVRRAVQLLTEAGRPMRMSEITEEWQNRGWVNPDWKAPKSAINMIFQRALKVGLVGRMPDRSWVLRTDVTQADGPTDGQAPLFQGGEDH
ncbi:hypothetical protein ACGFS9_20735 [Streptomyces sp. NPDC048566]|uniref:hypothetical protein n=1 Tax=Streptomyces sp. NPDC048566 TaxID=3365569 RepID=UPI00371DBDC4